MALAHIRSGAVIRIYPESKGWVDLENGQRVSPPIEGYINGSDLIVPYVEETTDASTSVFKRHSTETLIEADRNLHMKVVLRTTISDMPSDDVAARVRAERNDKLFESDWVVTKAVEQNAADGLGINVPMVWINYRQALRDISAQAGFPYTVTWPQEP